MTRYVVQPLREALDLSENGRWRHHPKAWQVWDRREFVRRCICTSEADAESIAHVLNWAWSETDQGQEGNDCGE